MAKKNPLLWARTYAVSVDRIRDGQIGLMIHGMLPGRVLGLFTDNTHMLSFIP